MRICKTCNQPLPPEAFHAATRVKDGRAAHCKICTKILKRGKHIRSPDKKTPYDPTDQKEMARQRVRLAVRRGKVQKPTCCQACGQETPARVLDAHHRDYSKPMDVMWLCRSCHGAEHLTWKPAA